MLKQTPPKRGSKQLKRTPLRKISRRKEVLITSAQKLKRTGAWRALSIFVRTMEGGVCFTCKAVNPISKCNAGHFEQAHGHSATFFETMNVHCQCISCNLFKSGNLIEYYEKMMIVYGLEEVLALRARARTICKGYTKEQLKEIERQFKLKLEGL
jgi:hypothetical protein